MLYKEIGPAIFQYEFSPSLAKDLVSLFNEISESDWSKSGIGVSVDKNQEIRTSLEYGFEGEMPISAQKVKEHFIPCVDHYALEFNIAISQDEGLNLLKYNDNGSKYDFHSDGSWQMYRTLSGLIYLNPQEYEGGETYFKYFDLSVHPENPSIVLFPSNHAYLHAAMPVTKGTKYVLVTWMNDMPRGFVPTILPNIAALTGLFDIQEQHNH